MNPGSVRGIATPQGIPYSSFRELRTFLGLDGIRAICALAVVVQHCEGQVGPPTLRFGFLGVDMFFVISGFLIVSLLIRERDRYGSISLRQFYIRRSYRIFPIYYLLIGITLLGFLAVSWWKPSGLSYYLNASWVLALYLQDLKVADLGIFFHTWSLGMEEQFYLVWPAIEKFASRLGKFVFLIALLAICQASNFGLTDNAVDQLYGFPQAHLRPLFLCTFTPIILGVMLAHALHTPKMFDMVARVCGLPIAIPFLVAVIVMAAELAGPSIQGFPRLIIHVAMTLLLAAIVMLPRNLVARILEIRQVAFIGKISYGVYLYHVMILSLVVGVLHALHIRPLAVTLVALVAPTTLLVASGSYRWIERPLLRRRPVHIVQPPPAPVLAVPREHVT